MGWWDTFILTIQSPIRSKDASLNHELPVDLALGKVDYIEVMGFAEHKSTANVWYRLLNCGFHLPTAAGTDAMANFASLRGPVGLNRVYAKVPAGPLNIDHWLDSIKHGRTFATNGPLLGFSLGGKELGDELSLPAGENKVKFTAWLRSFVPVDHLQVICDGDVVRDLKLTGNGETADFEDTLPISRSGWCLLRAWSEKAEHPILDMYPYATTSPIYVKVAGSHPKACRGRRVFRRLDRSHDRCREVESGLEYGGGEDIGTGDVVVCAEGLCTDWKMNFRTSPPCLSQRTGETRTGHPLQL